MNLIWVVILALVAGPDGRPAAEGRVDPRPSMARGLPPIERPPTRSIAPPRRAHRSPFSSPWMISGDDEFGAEEADETWFLQLDAAGMSVADWSSGGPPR